LGAAAGAGFAAAGAPAAFGAAGATGFAAAAAAAGAAGFVGAAAATFASAGAWPADAGSLAPGDGCVGWPVTELVSLVVAVVAAAGLAGFGAGGSVRGSAGGAADAPAPGESVRDTSPFNGSPGASLAGLSAAACGRVPGGVSGGFGSSDI